MHECLNKKRYILFWFYFLLLGVNEITALGDFYDQLGKAYVYLDQYKKDPSKAESQFYSSMAYQHLELLEENVFKTSLRHHLEICQEKDKIGIRFSHDQANVSHSQVDHK